MTSAAESIRGKTAPDARAALQAQGWREIATGDWSWVLASPDGARAARVTPWDAAYRMHAEVCLKQAHPHLPRIDAIAPLAGEGYAVFMERLWPCDVARAETFCAALGFPRDTDKAETIPDPSEVAKMADAPETESLRAILAELFARAAALPFFGGSDIRPGNLMCDAAGVIKVIDPIYVAGRNVLAAIEAGDRAALRKVSLANLQAFLTIPVFKPGPETEALRTRLLAVY